MNYYVDVNGRSFGPFDLAKLKQMIERGSIGPDALLSTDKSNWLEAASFSELFPSGTPYVVSRSSNKRGRAKRPVSATREWFVSIDGKVGFGPYTGDDLLNRLRGGEFNSNALVWRNGEKPRVLATEPFFAVALASLSTFVKTDETSNEERLDRRAAERLNRSLRFRFASACVCLAVAAATFAFWGILSATSTASGLFPLALVSALAFAASFVFSKMFLYSAWRSVPKGSARTTPAKAVGCLFIPFWQFYWTFVAYRGCAIDLRDTLARFGVRDESSGEKIALVRCVLFVSVVLSPAVPFATIFLYNKLKWAAIRLNDVRSSGDF